MKLRLIALLVPVLLAGDAQAQTPPGTDPTAGKFSISPARREIVARPPVDLVPTRVSNTTDDIIRVRVFPVLLRQAVDGSFDFEEQTDPLRTAAKILSTTPRKFVLEPGGVRDVLIRWQLLPRKARAAYVGIVFEGRPPRSADQPVNIITRLLSVNFLSLPGRRVARGRWLQLNPSQFTDKALRFVGRLRNTGNTIESPSKARLVIRKVGGGKPVERRWRGDVVLPKAERDFVVDVRKVLPAGDYRATLKADFGRSKGIQISERFTLAGPNQLPTSALLIDRLQARGDAGDPVRVEAQVLSTGSAPASTTLSLELFRLVRGLPEREPVSTEDVDVPELEPHEATKLAVTFGKLEEGPYRLVGTYEDQSGSTKTINTDFSAEKAPDIGERFGDFLRANGLLFAILVAIAVAALVAGLMWRRQRRLERELQAAREGGVVTAAAPVEEPPAPEPATEPAAPPILDPEPLPEPELLPEPLPEPTPEPSSPAPPAPAAAGPRSPGLIDLNAAAVDELLRLPGVGRKAAERIVADRERNGPFASVDDLARVEGFDDPTRIRRLGVRATV